jgi:hypothetical protein
VQTRDLTLAGPIGYLTSGPAYHWHVTCAATLNAARRQVRDLRPDVIRR